MSSRCLLRTLVHQIEQYVSDFLRQSMLPADIRILPLRAGERYVVLDGGRRGIISPGSLDADPVSPPDFHVSQLTWVSHSCDRGSTNVAVLHFCLFVKMCWLVVFGPYHDQFNGMRSAAKAVGWWTQIVQFASIANMNYGPFRSGAWGSAKQERVAELAATSGKSDSE